MILNKKISELITPKFYEPYSHIKNKRYTHYVFRGGRGSSKSSNLSILLILRMIQQPANGVVIRKVARTLENTVYAQLEWAINYMGISEYFNLKKSPMEMTYLPTGNKIVFLGADDTDKVKGLVGAKFPFAWAWFEEVAEFKSQKEVQSIINSVLRGTLDESIRYQFFYSYNPPAIKQHWCNRKWALSTVPENTYVHTSSYLDNPYISDDFKIEAEQMKKEDELAYRHIYLGEVVGTGVVPFPKLNIGPIPKEIINSTTVFRQGIDWGYSVDPVAFTRWGYDRIRKIIWAVEEIYGVQMSNEDLAKKIKIKRLHTTVTTCDSSEPKSKDDIKRHGCLAKNAKKGKGSVERGEKWLGEHTIYIDPKRTPHTAREFESIDYDTDRYGDIIPRLMDKNNHTIDSGRYAFEDDMRASKRRGKITKPPGT